MKAKFNQKLFGFGRTSLIAISCLVASGLVQPQSTNAAMGIACWPFFILGGALLASGTATEMISWEARVEGFYERAYHLEVTAIAQLLTGVIFLDDEGRVGNVQKVTPAQAKQYGLNSKEMQAYNQAVENAEMDAIFQTAAQELDPKTATPEDAKKTMEQLLGSLDPAARSGFIKISTAIVRSHS